MYGYATVVLCRTRKIRRPPPPPGVNDSVLGSESVYERHSVVPCLILPQTKIVPVYSPNIIGAIFVCNKANNIIATVHSPVRICILTTNFGLA